MEPSTSSGFLDSCGNYEPGFANLPMEIILKIFRYLNFYDIQASSLTCRRWLQASECNEFQSKVLLRFSKPCSDDSIMPNEIFMKTQRAYHNLYLDEMVFGTLQNLFQPLSKTVEKLILISTDLTDKQFYTIVQQLPNVNDLTIENCTSLFMAGQFLESEEDRDRIQNWLYHIKKLSLRKNQYLSDAILLRITTLINGIEKLDLCGCHIAYHSAIQRRFYPPDLENTPSESILTFKFLLNVIERHASTITELNLSHTLIGGPALSTLSSIDGLNLKKVKFYFCRQLNYTGLNTFTNLQKNISELNISFSDGITDSCIELITDNLILLEKFYLRRCRKLTILSSDYIARLTKLKVLDISLCEGMSQDGNLNGIIKNNNLCLEELYIVAIDVCEEFIIQISEIFKNLRVLDIGHCVNGATDRSVQSIISNLRHLKSLDMEGCALITDAAVTGINVSTRSSSQRTFSPPSSIDGFYIDPNSDLPLSPELVSLNYDEYSPEKGAAALPNIPLPPQPPAGSGNSSNSNLRISLRSKAEDEIIQDAERKKAIMAIFELNLNEENHGVPITDLKGLQSINLQGCKISDVSLKYGLKFVELRRIILSTCHQISVTGIEYLVKNCPAIEDLDVSDSNINDKSIQYIAKGLKRLRILNISGCAQLTDHSIDSLVVNAKSLQCLSLNRCRRIRAESDYILKHLPSLRNINIDRPSNFENADIFRLRKRMEY